MDKHPDYWRIKALVLEAQLVTHKAQVALSGTLIAQRQVMADAGLNPDRNYEFVDADEAIVPA